MPVNRGETTPLVEAVIIGASAGAIDALNILLPRLPRDYPLPVIVAVHLQPDKTSMLPELFATRCQLKVKEAEDKEPIRGGTVYFVAPDYHLLVEPDLKLSLSSEEPVLFSRPSIDVLFESAADGYGSGLLAVMLTGANADGARGAKAVCDSGGVVLVQRPDTAEVPIMPQAALDACPSARAMTLEEIAQTLCDVAKTEKRLS